MAMLDPFLTENAFEMGSLTAAINILPNNYGRLREMGLFPPSYMATRTVYVEEKNGVLSLLKTYPVGAPAQKAEREKRVVRSFKIPHIPYEDTLTAQDFEGIRAFGSENQMMALNSLVNERLQAMRNNHAITLEYLRIGALKGIIYDADGSTLYNLYNEFVIKPKKIDFVLGTSTTNVKAKCYEVKRWIEDHLLGEIMSGVHVLVHKDFFDALIGHDTVKEHYLSWSAAQIFKGDMRTRFDYGGITFEEYNGTSSYQGTPKPFFTSKYGIAFPLGTNDTFRTIFAPPSFLSTAGIPYNQPVFAKSVRSTDDRHIDLITESNPLPICMRPGVLVEVYSSN